MTSFEVIQTPRNPRDPFFPDLFSIRPGVTVAEVETIMALHKRGTGRPAIPLDLSQKGGEFVIQGALVFRPASGGPGDADWGIVYFERWISYGRARRRWRSSA